MKSADKNIWVCLDNRRHSDLKQICRQFKAHLKYRDTEACETSANDREKCALKWLFVELVVETDTLYIDIELVNATLENNARVQIPKEPPPKSAF